MSYMTGDKGFLSILLLTALPIARSPSAWSSWRKTLCSGNLHSSYWPLTTTDAHQQRSSMTFWWWSHQALNKISQLGVFQKHSFLTWIMASYCSLYFDIIWDSAFQNIRRNLKGNRRGRIGAERSQEFLWRLHYLKFSFIKDIPSWFDTKRFVVLVCFLTCKRAGPGNLPSSPPFGYSTTQIAALKPTNRIPAPSSTTSLS